MDRNTTSTKKRGSVERMSGAVTILLPHAFMVWTGPALLLYLIGFIEDHQKYKSNTKIIKNTKATRRS
jgi:hypothetical protein